MIIKIFKVAILYIGIFKFAIYFTSIIIKRSITKFAFIIISDKYGILIKQIEITDKIS